MNAVHRLLFAVAPLLATLLEESKFPFGSVVVVAGCISAMVIIEEGETSIEVGVEEDCAGLWEEEETSVENEGKNKRPNSAAIQLKAIITTL